MYSTNSLLSIGKVRQIKMAKISTEVANHSIAGHIQFCAYNIQEYAYVYGRLCCRPSAACVARREWRCACARDFRRRAAATNQTLPNSSLSPVPLRVADRGRLYTAMAHGLGHSTRTNASSEWRKPTIEGERHVNYPSTL